MKPINFLLLIVAMMVAAFLVLTSDAFGQSLNGDLVRLRPTTVPATCNNGDLRVDANDGFALKICTSNTWDDVGGNPFSAFTTTRVLFGDGTNVPATSAALTFNSGTGALTATSFVGALTGNADTATALSANPADCSSDTYANAIATNGTLTCASITNASTTGTAVNTGSTLVLRDGSGNFAAGTITASLTGDVTGNVSGTSGSTTGNAATATALAANPSDCSASQFANTIAANGNLSCAQVTYSDLGGTAPAGGTNDAREYVTNGKFETDVTGWTTYDDAAAAPVDGTGGTVTTTFLRTTTAGEVIRETGSAELQKDAANRQGEGVCVAFTMDRNEAASMKPAPISFEYQTTTNYASGDVLMHAIDVTAGTVQALQTVQSTTAGTVLASSTPTRWNGVIYPTTTNTSYKLCWHIATTNASAWDMHIDSVHVGNQNVVPGAIVTEWVSYTPTGTWSTNTTYTGKWRRIGDTMEVMIKVALAGAPTSANLRVNLPSGFTIDTAKQIGITGSSTLLGMGMAIDASTANYLIAVNYYDTGAVAIRKDDGDGTTDTDVTQAAPFAFGNTDSVEFWFKVPISNWAPSAALSTTETTFSTAKFTVLKTADQTISSTSATKITWNTAASKDTVGGWDSSNNRYSIKKTGRYRITASSTLGNASSETYYIRVYVNGSSVRPGLATGTNPYLSVTTELDLVYGDYVEIFAQSTADSSYDFQGTASTSSVQFVISEIPDFSIFAQYNSDRWYVNASFTGANPSLGVAGVTSYTEIIDAGLTLTPITGSAPVGTMCSATNAATAPSTAATTCAAGSESIGINFAIPEPGVYEVCFQGSWAGQVDSAEGVNPAFQLIETPTSAQTLTLESGVIQNPSLNSITIASGVDMTIGTGINVCGLFNWASTAAGTIKGVRLMYEQSIANAPDASVILADANASVGQRNANFRVRKF